MTHSHDLPNNVTQNVKCFKILCSFFYQLLDGGLCFSQFLSCGISCRWIFQSWWLMVALWWRVVRRDGLWWLVVACGGSYIVLDLTQPGDLFWWLPLSDGLYIQSSETQMKNIFFCHKRRSSHFMPNAQFRSADVLTGHKELCGAN